MAGTDARFDMMTDASGRRILAVEGDWTVFTIGRTDRDLRAMALSDEESGHPAAVDVSRLGALDTAGAYLILRTLRGSEAGGEPIDLVGVHDSAAALLGAVQAAHAPPPPEPTAENSWTAMLERLGRGAISFRDEALGILAFVGEAFTTVLRLMTKPHRIRWTSVVAVMEEAGLNALPIVTMLSFFIGLVVAFLGVNLLEQFGAQVFTVELVGVLMLREMGVLLTAILLAGRTDSAFTAQIGAMKMREEIDAMRVLGLDPMEVLVAPRMLALTLMTPFLTFFAMLSGIFGGLLVLWAALDISPAMFIQRIHNTVSGTHFWVGIVKAPVFALIVAMVGCRQGLLVSGDVQTLGQRTTTSVVQSIFLVIVVDALFALLYLELDL